MVALFWPSHLSIAEVCCHAQETLCVTIWQTDKHADSNNTLCCLAGVLQILPLPCHCNYSLFKSNAMNHLN